jgi:SAM-dependent methyltransferase
VSVVTWHYGIVARWWAQFHEGGPEVEFFERLVARGQPAFDLACGTGRLLVPFLRAGHDVDGCDVSPDMLGHCRDAARAAGYEPTLFAQPIHELDPPRRYRTIVLCGGFGIGTTRAQDLEGLRRIRASLEPGGLLAMDIEVPYADRETWALWPARGRGPTGPEPEPPQERRRGADGCDYALHSRQTGFDPLAQQVTREVNAWQWRDGQLVASESHLLTENLYFRNELVLLLERAGFADVEVVGGYHGGEPTGDEDFLVYLARPCVDPHGVDDDDVSGR